MRVMSAAQIALIARQLIDASGQQNGLVTSLSATNNNSGDNVTDTELLSYINFAVSEIWDILLSKAPENYGFSVYNLPVNAGVSTYPLPSDFKAILGVNIAIDNSGVNFISILPFNENQRNMFSLIPSSGSYSYLPYTSTRYQLQGQNISFIPNVGPGPSAIQIRYQPAAPILCLTLPSLYATSTTYSTGQLVYVSLTATNGVATEQVFMCIPNNGASSGTSSGSAPNWNVPGTTLDNNILWAYQGPITLFQTEFDGINGWEQLIAAKAALRIGSKQERDVSDLMALIESETIRINTSAVKRKSADPDCVTPGWGSMESGGFGGWNGGGNIGF